MEQDWKVNKFICAGSTCNADLQRLWAVCESNDHASDKNKRRRGVSDQAGNTVELIENMGLYSGYQISTMDEPCLD